ncbi:guanylate kinase [Jejuia pallidilutea]|uniref:Guanylate kinase n=1 Tax=Jejuia pallidilutea TaxID=504487 RepID=A0A090VYB1_9FLAO|nr:guanylate kinase [Jejuia pallidilutea]
MTKEKKQGKLIVFSAPSGSGKTTIVRHLLGIEDLNLEFQYRQLQETNVVLKLMVRITILCLQKTLKIKLKMMSF